MFLCQLQNFSDRAQAPFFWSHFLSTWSQSCAETQNFRRKEKKRRYLWGQLLHTPENEYHQWNDSKFLFLESKLMENKKKNEPYRKKLCPIHFHETRRRRGLGMLCSNCTLLVAALPCFFRSWYVRAAILLSISQARKWFPNLLCLKSKSPLISTWLSKESALPGVFVDFSSAREELAPFAAVRLPTVACIVMRNQTFDS